IPVYPWLLTSDASFIISETFEDFTVNNVSAPDAFGSSGPASPPDFISDDYLRVLGLSTATGTNRYAFSDFFQIRQGLTTYITNLTFTDIPPRKPESLIIIPETPIMDGVGYTNHLKVIARYADGGTNDVSARVAWTSYRVSNPKVASPDPDGVVVSS